MLEEIYLKIGNEYQRIAGFGDTVIHTLVEGKLKQHPVSGAHIYRWHEMEIQDGED